MKEFENIIWEFNLFIYFAVALTCHKTINWIFKWGESNETG